MRAAGEGVAIEAHGLRKRYGDVVIGLVSSSPEAANAYGFTIIFPLTFVSSAFVPVQSVPSWLQPIAEHNPVTAMVDALRALFLGIPAGNSVWLAVAWSFALIAVFRGLSSWRYRRAVGPSRAPAVIRRDRG